MRHIVGFGKKITSPLKEALLCLNIIYGTRRDDDKEPGDLAPHRLKTNRGYVSRGTLFLCETPLLVLLACIVCID